MLTVRLFGRLEIQRDGQTPPGLDVRKIQEFFCYLLLNRQRSHPREVLANLLCDQCSTTQSRKNLRQALWQLQAALNIGETATAVHALIVEPEWVCLNPAADLWLDVAEFEEASLAAQGQRGETLPDNGAARLAAAVDLYRGDLLEGWYQDWCLYERERLQNLYLVMLDKLMAYCEAHRAFEMGLVYGERILCYDGARERTHQRLMRLHYLTGDRAAALRQYERCVSALAAELGVKPSRRTVQLYEQIRADRLDDGSGSEGQPPLPGSALSPAAPGEVLGHLRQLQVSLAEIQRQLQRDAEAMEAWARE